MVDNTIPVAADFNTNFTNLNNAVGSSTVISSYTTGDIIYASATNKLSVLPIGTLGQVLTISASTIPAWSSTTSGYLDTLFGLALSNGTDATNDIDIAAGAAQDVTGLVNMALVSGITKQLDAAWAVGTNQGGRMSAAGIANTTYHVYLIERPDTAVVDVGFDTSSTAPTLPTNYTKSRRIGSIIRAGATILAFTQHGDEFGLAAPLIEVANATPSATAATLTLTGVPTGVIMQAILHIELEAAASTQNGILLSDLLVTDAVPTLRTTAPLATIMNGSITNSGLYASAGQARVWTNTSAQIRDRAVAGTGNWSLATLGWLDRRGRG